MSDAEKQEKVVWHLKNGSTITFKPSDEEAFEGSSLEMWWVDMEEV